MKTNLFGSIGAATKSQRTCSFVFFRRSPCFVHRLGVSSASPNAQAISSLHACRKERCQSTESQFPEQELPRRTGCQMVDDPDVLKVWHTPILPWARYQFVYP